MGTVNQEDGNMQLTNPCVRCGQERILSKVWTESISSFSSQITYSSWVCPDKNCQAVVDVGIKEKKEKAEALRRDIEKRALERKANKTSSSK